MHDVPGGEGDDCSGLRVPLSWLLQQMADFLSPLQVGDRIVTICGTSTEGMTHTQAVNLLKNAPGSIEMQVRVVSKHSSQYGWLEDTGALSIKAVKVLKSPDIILLTISRDHK